MSRTRAAKLLFRRATLRRLRLLGAVGWVAGCANLIGLNDYEESDDPVSHATGGVGKAGSAGSAGASGAGDGGDSSEGGRSTGGRAPATGGKAQTSGGAGGEPPMDGGKGPEPTGGQRSTGGKRGLGGEASTGGSENSAGMPASGGTAETGGAPASGGTPPTTGGTAPTGGATGTGGAAVTSCALPAYPAGCRACIDDSCDSQCNPCLANAECRALVSCAEGCVSGACLDDCFTAHENSKDAFLAVYNACAFTTCASTCGARFGASCNEDDDCASGTCSGPGGFCTYLCDDHEDCPLAGWCAPDVDGISRCLLDCSEDEAACPSGHHCGFVSTLDDYALPLCTSLAALSEPCSSSLECHSFLCTGTSNSQGWCSNPCVDNLSCSIDASCVPDSFGDALCLLDCATDADCAAYPESFCSPEIDLEGHDADVCWL